MNTHCAPAWATWRDRVSLVKGSLPLLNVLYVPYINNTFFAFKKTQWILWGLGLRAATQRNGRRELKALEEM